MHKVDDQNLDNNVCLVGNYVIEYFCQYFLPLLSYIAWKWLDDLFGPVADIQITIVNYISIS